MQSVTEILDEMESVEPVSEVVWNGHKRTQPVTRVSSRSFEVEGNRGGHYGFFTTGTHRISRT